MSSWNHFAFDDQQRTELIGRQADVQQKLNRVVASISKVNGISKLEPIKASLKSCSYEFMEIDSSRFVSLQSKYDFLRTIRERLIKDGGRLDHIYKHLDPGVKLNIIDYVKSTQNYINLSLQALLHIESSVSQGILRESLIPPDRPAPLHVSIIGDRIVQVERRTKIGDITDYSLEILRTESADFVTLALEDIQLNSNVDKRFIECLFKFKRLMSESNVGFSVERVGLNWQFLREICNKYKDEIPSVAFAQIQLSLDTTRVILDQYEEWRAYERARSATDISEESATQLIALTKEISLEILETPDVFDKKISDYMSDFNSELTDVGVSYGSIAPPAINSISNLFSKSIEFILNIIPRVDSYVSAAGIPSETWYIGALAIAALVSKFAKRLTGFDPLKFVDRAVSHLKQQYPEIAKILKI